MIKRLLCFLFLVICANSSVYAVEDEYRFDSPQKEKAFKELIAELRCPQCQNNNIADSNATISNDMRAKVYELVQNENYNKKQVVDYMKARYGNFITYNPPLTAGTFILWLAPILVIIIGAIFLVVRSRRQGGQATFQEEDEKMEAFDPSVLKTTPVAFWVGACTVLVVISCAIYAKTGSWKQVAYMHDVQKKLPELQAQFMNGDIVNMPTIEALLLGLRADVFKNPDHVDNWAMLGGLYMWANDQNSAKVAFAKAYQYAPKDNHIRSLYGQLLMKSADPIEYATGLAMLKAAVKENNQDVHALSALAFDAFARQNYEEAIEIWESLLAILPPDNPKVKTIKKTIEQAKLANEQAQRPTPAQN